MGKESETEIGKELNGWHSNPGFRAPRALLLSSAPPAGEHELPFISFSFPTFSPIFGVMQWPVRLSCIVEPSDVLAEGAFRSAVVSDDILFV